MTKALRIFISSPGDVSAERRRAALIIEKLAKDYARFFDIKPYLWETEPMLASGHFQDAILPPGETDILILILWARLGTPLPAEKYRGIDGRVPVTGTEWEFETALAAHRLRGAPDILSYKKTASPKAEYTSEADLERLSNQLRNLDAFWARYFVDKGEFRAAFRDFEGLDGFEAKLESDLRELIERRIAALSGDTDKTAAPTWLSGNPFRGLETFRFEHAPIFFGRSEATKTAVEHLVENAEAGRPFLLVLGASGSGKSSLAQAGIVPALEVRGVVPGVGAWRRTVVRPGGHPQGPFTALAAGLGGDDALPELLKGQGVAALARHLEAAAADPAYPIVSALSAREQAARQQNDLLSIEEIRLILVVDQLEELFTLGEVTLDQRKAFILCLKGLMASRRVFVVATMRSDYWHRAAEVPLLISLAEGHGRIDLLPPMQAEITEMIRRPAEVAGLTFDTDLRTDIRLDAALAEEAAREPGALPLLSFLLDALYATDVGEGKGSTLRYASMRALGGLKGAIATRAESAFAALPADAQAALPKVLRALVTVSRSGAEPTARAVPMARFADGSAERRVINAFLDPQVRLLVADGDGDGARVRVAHEALITHWERARRQIAQDRDDLRTRAVIEEALTGWRAADVRDKHGFLLRDPVLANATDLATRWSDAFDQETLNFIAASRRRARLLLTMTAVAAGLFALVAIGAAVAAWQAFVARNSALIAQSQADAARRQSDEQRHQAEKGIAAADEILQSEGKIEELRGCLAATDRVATTPRPLASKDFFAGRWHYVAPEQSNIVDWRSDGTCIFMNEIVGEQSRNLKDAICHWSFERISDDEFVLKLNENTGLGFVKEQRYKIINYNRIHNVDANWDLLRVTCPPDENDLYQKELLTSQQLAAADPANPERTRAIAAVYNRIGDALAAQSRNTEALSAYGSAFDIIRKLADDQPVIADWQHDLALSYARIGNIFIVLSKPSDALKAYGNGIAILRRLTDANQNNANWQHELFANYNAIGDLSVRIGKPNDARDAYQQSFTIIKKLADGQQENEVLQSELALEFYRVGSVSDPISGREAMASALAIVEKLEREHKLTDAQKSYLYVLRRTLSDLRGK